MHDLVSGTGCEKARTRVGRGERLKAAHLPARYHAVQRRVIRCAQVLKAAIPLYMRLPKFARLQEPLFKVEFQVVNLDKVACFPAGAKSPSRQFA